MTMISKAQIGLVKFLLHQLNAKEANADLVFQYSNGRTTSTSGLTGEEARQLITWLKAEANLPETAKSKMKRKIFSMAHEMRWEHSDGRINMEHLNEWCKKFSYKHKALDEYHEFELPALVTQFESVYQSFLVS